MTKEVWGPCFCFPVKSKLNWENKVVLISHSITISDLIIKVKTLIATLENSEREDFLTSQLKTTLDCKGIFGYVNISKSFRDRSRSVDQLWLVLSAEAPCTYIMFVGFSPKSDVIWSPVFFSVKKTGAKSEDIKTIMNRKTQFWRKVCIHTFCCRMIRSLIMPLLLLDTKTWPQKKI